MDKRARCGHRAGMRLCLIACLVVTAACPKPSTPADAGNSPLDASLEAPDAAIIHDEDAGLPDAAMPDAAMAQDAGAHETLCSDLLDDDGDGATDCQDADCEISADCVTEDSAAACSDMLDNDGDGYVDCTDFDCANHGPCGGSERDLAACGDHVDNDGDTYVDCQDFGCRGLPICSRYEDRDATCTDGVDNDSDGNTDCADSTCTNLPVCRVTETESDTCADGVDNDGDARTDCLDTGCTALPVCQGTRLRVVSWNIQKLTGGDPPAAQGQAALDAVVAMLLRMDADVACLIEVHDDEVDALAAVAAAAGYPHIFQAQVSTPMAGGLTNACISRRRFVYASSRSSNDISFDSSANETGRDFAQVVVELIPGGQPITIISAHFKSGFDDAALLRRHVESIRAAYIAQGAAVTGGVLFMGDLNEEITRTPGPTFTQPPDGMPFSYRLGADLSYPFTYDPFGQLRGAGLVAADARHEDSSNDATRIPSGRRIDYVMTRGVVVVSSEVYDPCRDNGVDDAPVGGFMALAGNPLSCGVAELASDHWPVVVDVR